MESNAPLDPILIADDESDDVFVLTHRLKKAGIQNPIVEFKDGADLVDYVSQHAESGTFKAALLLLDIKMPRLDGFDTLEWLRQKAGLKMLRVAMVSSSQRPDDKSRAFAAGANEYFEKFPSPADLADAVARAR